MNLAAFKDLTRIEQTLFGLPFLLAGALLPFTQTDVIFTLRILWIFPAFMCARISGMAFNQLIDRYIDAKNPRTEKRALPSGRVTEKQARLVAWSSLALFLVICGQINSLCFWLAPFAAFLLFLYSYLKRLTASCHFVLGMIHFLSPVMASAAVCGTLLKAPFFLGLAAACSIIGNDIVYALQDLEFDRSQDLFSLPSCLGTRRSLFAARLIHALCLAMLLMVGITGHLPIFYYGVIPLIGYTFYTFYRKAGVKMQEPLFFSCNVVVAFWVFAFILASVVWDVM